MSKVRPRRPGRGRDGPRKGGGGCPNRPPPLPAAAAARASAELFFDVERLRVDDQILDLRQANVEAGQAPAAAQPAQRVRYDLLHGREIVGAAWRKTDRDRS